MKGASTSFFILSALVVAGVPSALVAEHGGCDFPLDRHLIRVYNHEDGLPLDTVYDIQQDDQRMLWVGTEDGLARFDGREFERINLSPLIGDAAEFAERLALAGDDRLLVGLTGFGLVALDTRFTATSQLLAPLTSPVHAVHADANGAVLVGTRGEGLAVIDEPAMAPRFPERGRTGTTITAITPRVGGGYWIGYAGQGVQLFDGADFSSPPSVEPLGGLYVNDLVEDSSGDLWVGAREGLFRLDADDEYSLTVLGEADGLPEAPFINALAIDHGGNLWVGTGGDGIARLCNGQFEQMGPEDGLPQGHINRILEDHEGNMWLATGGGGLVRLSLGAALPITERHGLPPWPRRWLLTVNSMRTCFPC